jgi:hypothetical protein
MEEELLTRRIALGYYRSAYSFLDYGKHEND